MTQSDGIASFTTISWGGRARIVILIFFLIRRLRLCGQWYGGTAVASAGMELSGQLESWRVRWSVSCVYLARL